MFKVLFKRSAVRKISFCFFAVGISICRCRFPVDAPLEGERELMIADDFHSFRFVLFLNAKIGKPAQNCKYRQYFAYTHPSSTISTSITFLCSAIPSAVTQECSTSLQSPSHSIFFNCSATNVATLRIYLTQLIVDFFCNVVIGVVVIFITQHPVDNNIPSERIFCVCHRGE